MVRVRVNLTSASTELRPNNGFSRLGEKHLSTLTFPVAKKNPQIWADLQRWQSKINEHLVWVFWGGNLAANLTIQSDLIDAVVGAVVPYV